MQIKGLNRAILTALQEWHEGAAYSRQLEPIVSNQYGRFVDRRQIGKRLSMFEQDGLVERIDDGSKAFLWRKKIGMD